MADLNQQVEVLSKALESAKAENDILKAENESLKAGEVAVKKSDLPFWKIEKKTYTLKYANIEIEGKTYSAAEIAGDKAIQAKIANDYPGCVNCSTEK